MWSGSRHSSGGAGIPGNHRCGRAVRSSRSARYTEPVKLLDAGNGRPKAIVSQAIHTSTRTTRGTRRAKGSPAPWARHALTLLAVVWLNVAVQPCVMALAPDVGAPAADLRRAAPDSGAPERRHCPHCPPVQARSAAVSNGAAPHPCPASGARQSPGGSATVISALVDTQAIPGSCVDAGSDCGAFDATPPDSRGADLKVKPGAELVYLAPAWPSAALRADSELPPRWRTLSHLPGPPPALNCLHCVYLK